MKTERHYVYLEDECPTIGAGWRPVIARIGYKWVHIKSPNAERGKKISRKIWDKLEKKEGYRAESNSQGSQDAEISAQGYH